MFFNCGIFLYVFKVELIRGNGTLLRSNIEDIVTPEDVCSKWPQVTNMSNPTSAGNIQVIVLCCYWFLTSFWVNIKDEVE